MPVDRSSIDGQLRKIGEGERWWEQREFRDLPHILHSGETIRGLVLGQLLGRRKPRVLPGAPWLLVVTDQRLLCLQQERFGRKQVDVRGDQITGINHGSRIRGYRIAVATSQKVFRLRLAKADAFRFLGALSSLVPHLTDPDASSRAWRLVPGAGISGLPGLMSRVARIPAPEYARSADLARVEANVERLESEVERLQQQVEFLEKLLHGRAEEMLTLPEPGAEP